MPHRLRSALATGLVTGLATCALLGLGAGVAVADEPPQYGPEWSSAPGTGPEWSSTPGTGPEWSSAPGTGPEWASDNPRNQRNVGFDQVNGIVGGLFG